MLMMISSLLNVEMSFHQKVILPGLGGMQTPLNQNDQKNLITCQFDHSHHTLRDREL